MSDKIIDKVEAGRQVDEARVVYSETASSSARAWSIWS